MSQNEIITDNAIIILDNLKKNIISPESLTTDMRRVCVEYLHRQGEMNQEEMAGLLHVSTRTIRRDLMETEKNYASLLASVDYKRIIGTLLYEARNLKQKAMKKEDYRLAWQIEMDLIDKFIELGYLKKTPEEMIVRTEKVDEFTPEEARAIDIVLLEVKERRNREKMRQQGLIEGGDDGDGNGDGKIKAN